MVRIYAIYDRVAMEASQPFLAPNDGVGLRIFNASIRESPQKQDYRLYQIGHYKDASNLIIVPLEPPREVFSPDDSEGGKA
jgi:hypothetical protein